VASSKWKQSLSEFLKAMEVQNIPLAEQYVTSATTFARLEMDEKEQHRGLWLSHQTRGWLYVAMQRVLQVLRTLTL
jgi:hypothetical protein